LVPAQRIAVAHVLDIGAGLHLGATVCAVGARRLRRERDALTPFAHRPRLAVAHVLDGPRAHLQSNPTVGARRILRRHGDDRHALARLALLALRARRAVANQRLGAADGELGTAVLATFTRPHFRDDDALAILAWRAVANVRRRRAAHLQLDTAVDARVAAGQRRDDDALAIGSGLTVADVGGSTLADLDRHAPIR